MIDLSTKGISNHASFCLLFKYTNNDVFDDFSKVSDHFPNISEDSPKIVRRPPEDFRGRSQYFSTL